MFGKNVDPVAEAALDAAFPEGWFILALSEELGPAGVIARRAFGRDLVLWRTEDGVAHCAYATCPHMGVDMARGGTVQDGGLTCPIHGLRFGRDGRCLPRHPGKAAPDLSIRTFPVQESGGLVQVWRAVDGALPAAPPAEHIRVTPVTGRSVSLASGYGAVSAVIAELLQQSRADVRYHAVPVEQDRTDVLMIAAPAALDAAEALLMQHGSAVKEFRVS